MARVHRRPSGQRHLARMPALDLRISLESDGAEGQVGHASLVVLLIACGDMVAVPKPKHVNRLRLVMNAQPASQRREMCLNSTLAQSQLGCRPRVGACSNVGPQYIHLPAGGRERSTGSPRARHTQL